MIRLTRLQRWTIAGAAVIALGLLDCADPAPQQNGPQTCLDKAGHQVKCEGTVTIP